MSMFLNYNMYTHIVYGIFEFNIIVLDWIILMYNCAFIN